MKIVFIACLLLPNFIFSVAAQNIDKYYLSVHAAERSLSSEDFAQASKFYCEAFKQSFSLNADLRNGFKSALLAGDSNALRHIWSIVKDRPDVANSFKNNTDIVSHPNNIVKEELLSYTAQRKPTLLEEKIDSVRNEDVLARQKCRYNSDKTCMAIFSELDKRNIRFLKDLLTQNAYRESVDGQRTFAGIYLVALHARRWGCTDLDSLIYSYIKKGDTKPLAFAQLHAISSESDSINKASGLDSQKKYGIGLLYWLVNDTILHFQVTDDFVRTVNKTRSEIYLGDVTLDYPRYTLTKKYPLFKNSASDLGVSPEKLVMSKEQLSDLIKEFTQNNSLKTR